MYLNYDVQEGKYIQDDEVNGELDKIVYIFLTINYLFMKEGYII